MSSLMFALLIFVIVLGEAAALAFSWGVYRAIRRRSAARRRSRLSSVAHQLHGPYRGKK